MKNRPGLGPMIFFLGVLLVGAVGVDYVREFLKVDSCLDAGGSFDYSRSACDHERNHPVVTYSERHPASRRVAGAGALLVVAGVAVSVIRSLQTMRAR